MRRKQRRNFRRTSGTVCSACVRESGIKKSPQLLNYLEEGLFKWLKKAHVVESDIEALHKAGVTREIIGVGLIAVHLASGAEELQETLGKKRAREREHNLLLGSIAFLKKIGTECDDAQMMPSPLDIAQLLEMS